MQCNNHSGDYHSRCNRLSSRVDLFTHCRFESLRDDNIRPKSHGASRAGESRIQYCVTADGNCVDGTVLGSLLGFAVLLIFCMAPAVPRVKEMSLLRGSGHYIILHYTAKPIVSRSSLLFEKPGTHEGKNNCYNHVLFLPTTHEKSR
jgi:hypothetical protein